MTIRRLMITACAAAGGVAAAGWLHTAVALADPPEDPFSYFGYFVDSPQSPAQLAGLDALLSAQSPDDAFDLLEDVKHVDLTGTLATNYPAAPAADNVFVELLPNGATAVQTADAMTLDNALYALDPSEAPVLAAAAVPETIAAGDSLDLLGDPATPVITAVNGVVPAFQDAIGTQALTVYDTTAQGTNPIAVPVGILSTDYSQYSFLGGSINTENTVTGFVANSAVPVGITLTGVPGDGSVFDTFNFGGGLENVYSDILSGSGTSATSTVTDLLQFDGTTILNLTPLVEAFGISPADFGAVG